MKHTKGISCGSALPAERNLGENTMTTEQVIARNKLDAEIDARSRKQIKLQCKFCKYRLYDPANDITQGCDHVTKTGKLRDRGTGKVGECASFEPRTKETKAERIARARNSIRRSEANRK